MLLPAGLLLLVLVTVIFGVVCCFVAALDGAGGADGMGGGAFWAPAFAVASDFGAGFTFGFADRIASPPADAGGRADPGSCRLPNMD
ncbi:MAG: hypothetical protein RLN89_13230 [Parvibaculum sp.]